MKAQEKKITGIKDIVDFRFLDSSFEATIDDVIGMTHRKIILDYDIWIQYFIMGLGAYAILKGTEGVIGLTVESCGNGIKNQTKSCNCEPPPPPVAPPIGPLVELAPPTEGEISAL